MVLSWLTFYLFHIILQLNYGDPFALLLDYKVDRWKCLALVSKIKRHNPTIGFYNMDVTLSNKFNSIYIIETLLEGDLKTGRDLYEICIYPLGNLRGRPLYKPESTKFEKRISSNSDLDIDDCKIIIDGLFSH